MIIILLAFAVAVSALDVSSCTDPIAPSITHFANAINGSIDNTTRAHICHDNDYLHVHWWSIDYEIISTYTQCNDPLYKEDVVEIFLATEESYPYHYYELQVSPKGVLFFADITNLNQTCSNLQTLYFSCSFVADYGGEYTEEGWHAWLQISLQILGRGKKAQVLKGNMFRIDKNTLTPTRYLSLIPTLVEPACFHRPQVFTEMRLRNNKQTDVNANDVRGEVVEEERKGLVLRIK